MQTKDFLIGLMVALATIITIISYAKFQYKDMGVTVDSETDSLLAEISNKSGYSLDSTRSVMNDVRAKAPGGEDSGEANADQTVENNIIKQGWKALIGIPRSFSAFNLIVNLLAQKLGIDPMWSTIAVVSITFVLAMLLITAVMRSFTNV